MVKHGLLLAQELKPGGQEGCFKTDIHRNNGNEFDLPLLETDEVLATFDLVTRDTYMPWGKQDEIHFDVSVSCKCCGQRSSFSHGRTGFGCGSECEEFRCLCGRCAVRLRFHFEATSTLDVLDWVPGLGAVVRVGAAVVSHAIDEDDDAAEDHWEKAATNLVPNAIQKRQLLTKDGALTKVAELLPVSNVVAALIHRSVGNLEEADRAMRLLQNWQDIGSPDGALAKLAEVFPGTDVVAFALHMRRGNFARALRAVTPASVVTVRIDSASVTLDCSLERESTCLDLKVSGLRIGPTHRSVAGALVDFVEDLLKGSRSDMAMRRRSSEDDMLLRSSSSLPTLRELSNTSQSMERTSTFRRLTTAFGVTQSSDAAASQGTLEWIGMEQLSGLRHASRNRLDGLLEDLCASIQGQLPSILRTVVEALNEALPQSPARTWLLPDPLPQPSARLAAQIVQCAGAALESLLIVHHAELPTVEPISPASVEAHVWKLGPPLSAGLACAVALLLASGWIRLVALLCTVTALLPLARPVERLSRFSAQLAAWLTVHNARTWSGVSSPAAWRSARTAAGALDAARGAAAGAIGAAALGGAAPGASPLCGVALGLGRGVPSAAWLAQPPGVIVEVPEDLVQHLALLLRRYAVEQLLPLGWLLRLAEPLLRACGRALFPECKSVPVAIPVSIPEIVIDRSMVPDWPFQDKPLRIPAVSLALLLDVSAEPAGQCVRRLRAMVPDATVNRLTSSLAAQVSEWDWRRLSGRLSEFPDEVRCSFDLRLQWPSRDQLSLELLAVASRLRLPA